MEALVNAAEVLDSSIVAFIDASVYDNCSFFNGSLFRKHPIEYDVIRWSLVGLAEGNPSIVVAVIIGRHSKNRLIR